jgi:hypothetical protein
MISNISKQVPAKNPQLSIEPWHAYDCCHHTKAQKVERGWKRAIVVQVGQPSLQGRIVLWARHAFKK